MLTTKRRAGEGCIDAARRDSSNHPLRKKRVAAFKRERHTHFAKNQKIEVRNPSLQRAPKRYLVKAPSIEKSRAVKGMRARHPPPLTRKTESWGGKNQRTLKGK